MALNHRRQRIITDPELQRRIVISSVWPVVSAFAVMVASIGLVHWRVTESALAAGVEFDGVNTAFFAAYLLSISAAGFVVFHSLRMSHRVAGPLYRFRLTHQAMRSGDLDARVNLRSNDLLITAADDLNEFLEWVATTRAKQAEPMDAAQPEAAASESKVDAPTAALTD